MLVKYIIRCVLYTLKCSLFVTVVHRTHLNSTYQVCYDVMQCLCQKRLCQMRSGRSSSCESSPKESTLNAFPQEHRSAEKKNYKKWYISQKKRYLSNTHTHVYKWHCSPNSLWLQGWLKPSIGNLSAAWMGRGSANSFRPGRPNPMERIVSDCTVKYHEPA